MMPYSPALTWPSRTLSSDPRRELPRGDNGAGQDAGCRGQPLPVDIAATAICAGADRARRLALLLVVNFSRWWRRAVLNIAHPGASGTFPENTLSAFRAAIAAPPALCELDVPLTRDGPPVWIPHDTVNPTTA